MTDLLGYIAATCTTIAFVPQAWQTWKTRNAKGISLSMYAIFTLGVSFWLLYGLTLGAWPLNIANVITLILALFILAMKLRLG